MCTENRSQSSAIKMYAQGTFGSGTQKIFCKSFFAHTLSSQKVEIFFLVTILSQSKSCWKDFLIRFFLVILKTKKSFLSKIHQSPPLSEIKLESSNQKTRNAAQN
jgi:hypothetical protein